jgi:hypothetical protein
MEKTITLRLLGFLLSLGTGQKVSASDYPAITSLGPLDVFNHLEVTPWNRSDSSKILDFQKRIDIDLVTGDITLTKNSLNTTEAILKKCTSSEILSSLRPLLHDQQVCIDRYYIPEHSDASCSMIGRTGSPIFVKTDAEGEPVHIISSGGFLMSRADEISPRECASTYQICDGDAEKKIKDYAKRLMGINDAGQTEFSDLRCTDIPAAKIDPELLGDCTVNLSSKMTMSGAQETRAQCETLCRVTMKQNGYKSLSCE